MAQRIGLLKQVRVLAHEIGQITSLEDWQKRPIHTATAITDTVLGDLDETDTERAGLYKSSLINVLVAGLWNTCGKPVVTLGHKTAAACATARISGSDAEAFVKSPWPAFLIRLPSPLLTIGDVNGQLLDATLMQVACLPNYLVHKDGPPNQMRWWYKLCADKPESISRHMTQTQIAWLGTGLSLWNFNYSLVDILQENTTHVRWDTVEFTSGDLCTDWLARYLVINTCLFMESPNSTERESHTARNTRVVKSTSKPDELGSYDIYDLKAEGIKLNLCDAVRTYAATGKMPAHYARWVTPHWKRVVHGEKRALRRLQYIETYLRGAGDE